MAAFKSTVTAAFVHILYRLLIGDFITVPSSLVLASTCLILCFGTLLHPRIFGHQTLAWMLFETSICIIIIEMSVVIVWGNIEAVIPFILLRERHHKTHFYIFNLTWMDLNMACTFVDALTILILLLTFNILEKLIELIDSKNSFDPRGITIKLERKSPRQENRKVKKVKIKQER